MIRSFRNVRTEDVFNGRASKAARQVSPVTLVTIAGRSLEQLDSVAELRHLMGWESARSGEAATPSARTSPPGNRGTNPPSREANTCTLIGLDARAWRDAGAAW